MPTRILDKDDAYILSHCTKYLARDNTDDRHNLGQYRADDLRGRICEAWRFPIIDSFGDESNVQDPYASNQVTFVYESLSDPTPPTAVAVIGSFADLYQPIPLTPVTFLGEPTKYFAVTVVVPKGEVHTYKFLVDGKLMLDPINPQRTILDNGQEWSRFFTELATDPISFEGWEAQLLNRLTTHILPFRTTEGERFLNDYYFYLDTQAKETQYPHAYRFDESVGEANFIDKLLAREELHHLEDYKICLSQIDRILRERNPFIEPCDVSSELFVGLYEEMATDRVVGWDYAQYQSPRYFLQLLRRHTYTGAFSHPRYGGNAGGSGWAYLGERYKDESGHTLFDWRRVMELPFGTNEDYHG
jgi:hypothetical protein